MPIIEKQRALALKEKVYFVQRFRVSEVAIAIWVEPSGTRYSVLYDVLSIFLLTVNFREFCQVTFFLFFSTNRFWLSDVLK